MTKKEDRPVIVSQFLLDRLQVRTKFWYAGWATSLVLGGVICFSSGAAIEHRKAARELDEAVVTFSHARAELNRVNEAFQQAWEGQRAEAKAIIAWGEYIKKRDELSQENRDHAPYNRPMALFDHSK